MRVHHLDCGSLCPPCQRAVNGHGRLLARGRMVCHCLLVEHPRGLVLVETGLGRDDRADGRDLGRWFRLATGFRRDPEGAAVEQVRALGFDPTDVRDVVVTHLDLDHAGGLPDFPHARVHLHAREWAAAQARATLAERRRYIPRQLAAVQAVTYDDREGDRWMGLDAIRGLEGLGDEILLVPLPGHTRGHSAVAVRGEAGWLLHGGDAWFFRGEMDAERPTCPAGLRAFQRAAAFDNRQRLEAQARVRAALQEKRNEIDYFCAHDPEDLDRCRARLSGPG